MRVVPLKTVSVRLAGQPDGTPDLVFAYADTIFGVLNAAAAERGVPLTEVTRALRVIGPVQHAVAQGALFVRLEDADFDYLSKQVENYRGWRLIHKAVEDFVADIRTSPAE